MQILPYLFFEGRCDEAIEFYRGALAPKRPFSCATRRARSPLRTAKPTR